MNKTELSNFIADKLEYYIDNPKKRCRNKKECKYSGRTLKIRTKGCLIGGMMSPKDRVLADEKRITDVYYLIKNAGDYGIKVPKFIVDNPHLMSRLQGLHDIDMYWNKNGLNKAGKNRLISIIEEYRLIKKPFKKFLL